MMRNTQERDTKKSPAQVLFGRPLRDFLPSLNRKLLGELWEMLADQRAHTLAKRGTKMSVFIQNQEGNYPCRWDKRGQVIEVKGYDQYIIKVDGSRRLTRRNRKYLRKFVLYKPDGMNVP